MLDDRLDGLKLLVGAVKQYGALLACRSEDDEAARLSVILDDDVIMSIPAIQTHASDVYTTS